MEGKRIFEAQKNISVEIAVHISELDFALDEYLGGFERKDFFTFGDSEKRDKLYKQAYYRFMSGIAELLSSLEDSFAALSSLLISADEAAELDMLSLIGAKLGAYRAFEESLKGFASATQSAISKDNISPAFLVNEARRLKLAIEELKRNINNA
jgi:glucan phosphorylase